MWGARASRPSLGRVGRFNLARQPVPDRTVFRFGFALRRPRMRAHAHATCNSMRHAFDERASDVCM
eukprot:159978-Prymnesium_polylepis.1